MSRWAGGVLAMMATLAAADAAQAELVVLSTGRVLSVKVARVEGMQAVLTLRSGGELVCDAALIAEVRPDEVAWPEPETAPVAVSDGALGLSAPFAELIDPLSRSFGVDPALVHAVVSTESAYVPEARSRKGALGLMQLMPATARQYGVSNPLDPRENLEAGIRHLRSLLDRYDLGLALAAYNAGEQAVVRFGGIPPYPETRAYVARILRLVSPRGAGASQPATPGRPVPTRTRPSRS